jgi:hypothetical protein
MNFSIFEIIIKIFSTFIIFYFSYKFIKKKINNLTSKDLFSITSIVLIVSIFWLVNIGDATRVTFIGIEIDKSIEKAEKVIKRLEDVEKTAQSTKDDLKKIQKESSETVLKLDTLISKENKIFEIQKLQDQALEGDFNSYELLNEYNSEDLDLNERARSAIIAIKGFYIGKTKIKGFEISYKDEEGKPVKEENFETSWLIDDLIQNEDWKVRTKIAELLKSHKEIGVPEALLDSMENDPNLWVRKEALNSFESVTGFKANDVFQFETGFPRKWYLENKEEVSNIINGKDEE